MYHRILDMKLPLQIVYVVEFWLLLIFLISLLDLLSPRFMSTSTESVILLDHTTHMYYEKMECSMFPSFIFWIKIPHVGKDWGKNFNMDYINPGIWMYHFYFLFFFMVSSLSWVSNDVILTLISDFVGIDFASKSFSCLFQWLQECVKGWLRGCLVRVFKQPFSIFKQHFTYFNAFFHPHVFP